VLSMLCAALAACAGGETPTPSPELAADIAEAYAGEGEEASAIDDGTGGAPSGDGVRSDEGGAAGTTGEASGRAAAGGAPTRGSGGEAAAAEGGAGATAAPSAAAGASSSCDGFAILAASCGTSGCHGKGSNLEEFATSEEEARAYIDRPGTLACLGQGDVIDPDAPAASLMLKKLTDDPPCGQRMPLTGNPLSNTEIQCITDWIGGL
jgi:hypothetical protein